MNMLRVSRFIVPGAFFIFLILASPVQAAFECPEGFYWSRETVACEQTTCPPNSHRNYTLECICDTGYDKAAYAEIGLLASCTKGVNTNSAGSTETTGSTVSADQPSPPQAAPELRASNDDINPVLPFVPSERVTQFRELARRYREAIPIGAYGYGVPEPYIKIFNPGQFNNLVFGANSTACGGYQDQVLKWLLGLYFSRDPADRALLDGFDFGPIQITKGAHQAVVFFPKGTDWRSNGIVFDPWVEQQPRLYTIDEWDGMFFLSPNGSVGNILTPIDSNIGKFPTTPDASGQWEYDDVYSSKPRSARNRANGGRRVVVQSPVAVLVTSLDGSAFGLKADGSFVNDFGIEAEGTILLKTDGTYATSLNLPDDSYTATLTGTDSGDVHVFTSGDSQSLSLFEPVSIKENDQLTLTWAETDDQPVLMDADEAEITAETIAIPSVSANDNTNTTAVDNLADDVIDSSAPVWQNPLLLGGAGFILILVILALARRRSGK